MCIRDRVSTEHNQSEVIIVDDGSTDSSLSVVERIKREYPNKNITIHSQVNAGVSAARNKGIALAQNELITFLDADDSYEPDFYNEIAELVAKFPYASVFATGYRFVNIRQGTKRDANLVGLSLDTQQIMDDFFYTAAYGDLPITSSSVCIKKRSLNSVGGFPEGQNMGEDQAVWSQLALKYLMAISQKVCANYFEDTSDSLMKTQPVTQEMPYSLRLQTQIEQQKIPEKFQRSVEEYISGHLLDLVRRNSISGNIVAANQMIADKRSRVQLKRWSYWYMRVFLKRITL